MSGPDAMKDQARVLDEKGLAPCPFCGANAERHEISEEDEVGNAGGSVIVCQGCGACSPVHFDRKENLEDSWNRRAYLAAVPSTAVDEVGLYSASQVAALEGELREAKELVARLNGKDEYQHLMRLNNELLARAETAERELSSERARLQQAKAIIAKCCNALPNGAFCSPDASLEFMAHVPEEIALVIASERARTAEVVEAARVLASIPDDTKCNDGHMLENASDDALACGINIWVSSIRRARSALVNTIPSTTTVSSTTGRLPSACSVSVKDAVVTAAYDSDEDAMRVFRLLGGSTTGREE